MSLQFIAGAAGTGKSFYAYERILREADLHPEVLYSVVVPEQFTLQVQKTVVEMSPGKGILNIDVVSFQRLAYRVFEEVGGDALKMLEDTGKSMVLLHLAQQYREDLPYLGSQMKSPGCLDEVKSLLSEFMQYDIGDRQLEQMEAEAGEDSLLSRKLRDMRFLYRKFREALEGQYMTGEEVPDVLAGVLHLSERLRGSVLLLDGFTGFTPIQVRVIRELMALCSRVMVTVTIDARENLYRRGNAWELFSMSRTMIRTLTELTRDREEPVLLRHGEKTRFAASPALKFLEEHLFRYGGGVYQEPQENIRLIEARGPQEELKAVAERIARLIRTRGFSYGDIAVITGNLETYAPLARQVFGEAGIPFFIDETHSVMMNPLVEFLRSAMELVLKNYTGQSVFRYLHCQMSGLSLDEADLLENYVLATGIRGKSAWGRPWERIPMGTGPEELARLNTLRERLQAELSDFSAAFGKEGKTVRDYAAALYQLMLSCSLREKLKAMEEDFHQRGELSLEKEYAQIYGIVVDLLDRMVEILGEERLSRQEFLQILETGFSKAKIALIPPGQDQVLVGDMERTRLKDIRALFFIGVNEGNIPREAAGGGILSEPDRDFLEERGIELAPGPRAQMAIQRFYLYLNLTRPSEYLFLSWCTGDAAGESLSPAYLVSQVRTMFPDAEEKPKEDLLKGLELPDMAMDYLAEELTSSPGTDREPLFWELYSWLITEESYRGAVKRLLEGHFALKPQDRISSIAARVLYGEISPQSATRLERFAACAFAHYVRYGLKALERQEYEFRAADLGNIVHQTLEEFAASLKKQGLRWAELDQQMTDRLLEESLAAVTGDYGSEILSSSARNEYMLRRARRILRRALWSLAQQLKNGSFEPEGFEVAAGGGRIDRVDTLEEPGRVYVKVIDYKTGNTRFDLVEIYYGLQLQLSVYLQGALGIEKKKHPEKEVIPAGIFYYQVKDPVITDKMNADLQSLEEKLQKELKLSGLLQADPEVARKMDCTLLSLPVELNKDGSFGKRSSVADTARFETLLRFAAQKTNELISEIREGQTRPNPVRLGNRTACDYCPYKASCGFDSRLPGYHYQDLPKMDKEEIWRAMEDRDKEELPWQ